MKPFALGGRVGLDDLIAVAEGGRKVGLGQRARDRMRRSRRSVDKILASGEAVYGVNTGYGSLASVRIPPEKIRLLNLNYIRSHSSGVGEPLEDSAVRGIMFLRANELARGVSAVRPELVERLAGFLNRGVTPVVPSQGSVGASGDLAPMAHIALALIGEGEARFKGRRLRGPAATAAAGQKPLIPQAKEALSLTNGTQAMQSAGGLCLAKAARLVDAADAAGAASLEAIKGTPDPFGAELARLKPHPGQLLTAARLRGLLAGSTIRESHREDDERVQDPYSFRCMPQIHGAARDAVAAAKTTLEREMNSSTDNPVLAGGGLRSGGNFHGMALGLALDHAAVGLAVLGGVCERRVYYMTAGHEESLPLYLAENPGVESGFMIQQYAAAALSSENMTLAHPASVGNVPTSANKEDFVSMGMWAALKLGRVVDNTARILAIEMLAATRGIEFLRPLRSGRGVERMLGRLRRAVPFERGDAPASGRIETVRALLLAGEFA